MLSQTMSHLEKGSKDFVSLLGVHVKGRRTPSVSKCSALPSTAVFGKDEPWVSSSKGIWFPISAVTLIGVFNTTHRRDERRR